MKKFLAETYLWILLVPWVIFLTGAASNQLAVIANHDAMPVLVNDAKIHSHGGTVDIDGRRFIDPNHTVMDDHTHLKVLCDIIDIDGIESVGDLGIDLGQWMWSYAPYLWGFLLCLKVRRLTT